MATFVFECSKCNTIVETSSREAPECTFCKIKMQRVYTAPMVIIRGGIKAEIEADEAIKDYYRGQMELDRGELTQTEIEERNYQILKRCEKTGMDPGYILGNPKPLSKEELAERAKKQREEIERSLRLGGKNG